MKAKAMINSVVYLLWIAVDVFLTKRAETIFDLKTRVIVICLIYIALAIHMNRLMDVMRHDSD